MNDDDALASLYGRLIEGWNVGDAAAMAAPLASEGWSSALTEAR